MSEVADDLSSDWHTVMDAVAVFGRPLIDDPSRFGTVTALNPYMTSDDCYLWDRLAAVLAAGYENRHLHLGAPQGSIPRVATSGATRRGPGVPNAQYLTIVDPTVAEQVVPDVLTAG